MLLDIAKLPTAENSAIRLHPSDNVAVARIYLASGVELKIGGTRVVTRDAIPVGHKVAIGNIAAGEVLRRYGQIIGRAKLPIEAGQTISQPYVVAWMIEAARVRADAQLMKSPLGNDLLDLIAKQRALMAQVAGKFIQGLLGVRFQRDELIGENVNGIAVTGTARVAGKLHVRLHESNTESNFDVLVRGEVLSQLAATRRPVDRRASPRRRCSSACRHCQHPPPS